jgi:hypothetical protein
MAKNNKCIACTAGHGNPLYKDSLCEIHWKFYFAGMSNRERMNAKRMIRINNKERKSE